MGRRTVLLLAAILVAAVGTGLVFLYVQGADQRAQTDQQLVTAYRAVADIPAGRTLNQAGGNVVEIKVPTKDRGGNWLSRPSDVDGQVTKTTIPAGSIILVTQFSKTPQAGGNDNSPIDIADGAVAVTVQMSDTGRVAGFIRQGSSVAVFVNRDSSTSVLFDSLRVITVGGFTTKQEPSNPLGPETLPKSLVTLEVPAKDADKLILASTSGELYFALKGPGASVQANDRATAADLP